MAVSIKNLIAPAYYKEHLLVKENKYTHFVNFGGRGSAKSSFASIEIPLGIMKDPNANAVCMRKVGDTLADSVYSQLQWGIEMLGVTNYFKFQTSPLKIIYKPTGQQILFRSANNKEDYKKVKSIKFKKGYCKYVWLDF